MKWNVISVLAIIGMLNLTSCMQDHRSPSDMQKEIKVSAAIEGAANSTVKTRVTNNSWNDSDAIGIFMKKSGNILSSSSLAVNAKYVTNGGGNFSPTLLNEIHFPFNDDKVDFIAYYPFTNSLDGLNYLVDVSDQSSLSNIDLLYSNNAKGLNASIGNVELNFKHQLSNVILNISMDENPDYNLTGLKVEITNVYTKASFSLVDSTLTNQSELKDVSFNMSENGKSAQAILLPTTSLIDSYLTLTIDTISYSFNFIEATNITKLEKSTKHTLNVTLKPGEDPKIESVTSNIEDWIDGTTEDVIADENSTYIPPDNPSGGNGDSEGEGSEGNGEGEETEEGNNLEEGDGTEENPYTVEQVQNISLKSKVWVKGYIVGMYTAWAKSSFIIDNFENATSIASNIAIANSSAETDFIKTFRIDLVNSYDLGKTILLDTNPNNFGKKAHFYGEIINNPQHSYGEGLMLKTTKAIFFED